MPGSIKIDDGSGNYTILTNAGSLGSDKTLTIPNTTGTAALTSDVKIKQIKVVDGDETGDETVSTVNYGVTSLTASITPSSTSSKILVTVSADFDIRQFTGGGLARREGYISLARNNTASEGSAQNGTLIKSFYVGRYQAAASTSGAPSQPSGTYSFIDSPSSTSSTSYTLTVGILNTFIQATYKNTSGHKSQIILQEIETV
jgi:hypothetical protein